MAYFGLTFFAPKAPYHTNNNFFYKKNIYKKKET